MVDSPQEALLDAQVFKHLSRLTRTQVEGLSANSQKFNTSDFADKLFDYFHDTFDPEIAAQRVGRNILPQHYVELGNKLQHVLVKPISLQYLYGSLEKDPNAAVTTAAKKGRQPRKSLGDGLGLATQTLVDDGKNDVPETGGASLTEILVESTMTQLKDAFLTSNEKEPVPYFDFVLDPNSFGKSVENMFHVSFLIKESRAAMVLGDNGLPLIQPLKEKKPAQEVRYQAILSLTMEEWAEMIQIFQIKTAMIKHDLEALRFKKIQSKKPKRS